MNVMKGVFCLVMAAAFFAGDAHADLLGKYQVITNDCNRRMTPHSEVLVRISDHGLLQVGKFVNRLNALSFESNFSFIIGTKKVFCIGDCYDQYEGAFVSENEFRHVRMRASSSSNASPLTNAGETNLVLVDNILTITSTEVFQPAPGPESTCLLRRAN